MSLLTVRHVTIYRYAEPVGLGEHRMMFRPRESHDLRLIAARLDIVPRPTQLRWVHDVFDNSVAVATFSGRTTELRFDSTVTLEHIETELPDYALEPEAATYPFAYARDDLPDLARALQRQSPAADVDRWAASFLAPVRLDRHDRAAARDDGRHARAARLYAPHRARRADAERDLASAAAAPVATSPCS